MSYHQRLKQGLSRTRERIAAGLGWSRGPEPDWERLEEALLAADVGLAATRDLLAAARASHGKNVVEILQLRIQTLLDRAAESSPLVAAPVAPEVILVVGVNGVGKTTTLAKLAHRFRAEGRKPLLVAADTFRAAAVEQLEIWAGRAGVELVRGQVGADPAAVVHDGLAAARSRGLDPVLLDTAGRLHTRAPLMAELAKLARVAARLVPGAPHQTLLVLDATVGSNGLAQARQFRDSLPLSGIVLSKLDGTAKGGIAVAVASELGLAVRFAGVGEAMEDLLPFSPEHFARALLGGSNGAD